MAMPVRLSLLACALAALAAPASAQGWREPPRSLPGAASPCTVNRVIDGDTLRCTDGRRVRMRGVDTPERGERGHQEATRELRRRVEGRTVTVVPHHANRGRVVADVYRGHDNVGRQMDTQGWSKPRGARR